MPALRTYTVVQEREIRISADSPEAAVHIASEAFEKNSSTGLDLGSARSDLKILSISAREDY